MNYCYVSVSPVLICPLAEAPASNAHVQEEEDLVVDLKKAAVLGEPIVGIEAITLDQRGPGALAARPLPSPKEPTQAAIDRHNLTHTPFEAWCPICIACRRCNDHHRLQKDSSRSIPLLVGDYCFVRNATDEKLLTPGFGRQG